MVDISAWVEEDSHKPRHLQCSLCLAKQENPDLNAYLTHFEQKKARGETFNQMAIVRRIQDSDNGFGINVGRSVVREHLSHASR